MTRDKRVKSCSKKDEYDSFGNYRQSDDYGHNPVTGTEDVKSIFQPFLEENEEILWSMCNGNPYAQSPAESDKFQGAVRKMAKAKIIIFVVALIVALLMLFGGVMSILIGIFVISVVSLIEKAFIFFLIAVIVTLIIWVVRNGSKNVFYAITDRRILIFGYSEFQEERFEDIQETKAVISRENKGRIVINKISEIYIMLGVEDPYRVKYILDNAIEKYKRSQW